MQVESIGDSIGSGEIKNNKRKKMKSIAANQLRRSYYNDVIDIKSNENGSSGDMKNDN